MFGADPFGFGTSPSRATRITATLKTVGASQLHLQAGREGRRQAAGERHHAGRSANRHRPVPGSDGHDRAAGSTLDLEILTFDNGNPEVQLTYTVPGEYEFEGIERDTLIPAMVPFHATSQADGTFTIAGVPTTLGPITVTAAKVIDGRNAQGRSADTAPVPAGITDVGTVQLSDFGTLYGASFSGRTGMATLYTVDPATGAATLVGSIGFWRVSAMAVSANGTIYATGVNPATGRQVLLTINPATGAGTEIGRTFIESLGYGDTIADIAFRPSDGVLFAYLEAGDGLGTINLVTGAATALG